MTAYNAKGSGNGVVQQATKYLYASPFNGSWQTGTVYPDSSDVLSQDATTKTWTITTNNGVLVQRVFATEATGDRTPRNSESRRGLMSGFPAALC